MTAENGAQGAVSPSLNILTQYIKDLSFENPGAPRSLQARDNAPAININVNVNANPISGSDFDVVLSLNAEAKDGDKVLFAAELVYGGVFRIAGFPQEHMLPVLFIECPRLLFPFARQIIADVTRNRPNRFRSDVRPARCRRAGQSQGPGRTELKPLELSKKTKPGFFARVFLCLHFSFPAFTIFRL